MIKLLLTSGNARTIGTYNTWISKHYLKEYILYDSTNIQFKNGQLICADKSQNDYPGWGWRILRGKRNEKNFRDQGWETGSRSWSGVTYGEGVFMKSYGASHEDLCIVMNANYLSIFKM